jgi:hypothetical protein
MSDPVLISLDVRDVDESIGDSSSPYGKDYAPRKAPDSRREMAARHTVRASLGNGTAPGAYN